MSSIFCHLPSEILVEIFLFAAYSSHKTARSLSLTSPWIRSLVEEALLFTAFLPDISSFSAFTSDVGLVRGPFPHKTFPINFFFRDLRDIPELDPSPVSRSRLRLVRNLWTIQHDQIELHLEEHVYTRLLLQLCQGVRNLTISATALSHFLLNKQFHFGLSNQSIYPNITHLTLLASTPGVIFQMEYTNADECVKILKKITHFTTFGYYHSMGLPLPLDHFSSLTHVAFPLILNSPSINGGVEYSSEDIFSNCGGWGLLNTTEQIQMAVFLFPPDGMLRMGAFYTSTQTVYHEPFRLILDANALNRKAYAVPVNGLRGLQGLWYDSVTGGPDLWELAKLTLAETQKESMYF